MPPAVNPHRRRVPALTAVLLLAAASVAARNAAAASAAEAGLVDGKPAREMCLVVHPDYGIACAMRLPLEHTLTRTASLASAWSAKLSRSPSGKLEGELLTQGLPSGRPTTLLL